MVRGSLVILGILALSACTQNQLASQPGQLFCAINTNGGSQIVAGLIDAAASAETGPLGGQVAVIATNATAAQVQANCAKAAAAVGAKAGVPVSPPTGVVPSIAIKTGE